MALTVALSGDSIINRPISRLDDERVASVVRLFQEADIGFTHLETLIHDYEGPELHPAAEAGWSWMRSPASIVEELVWAGFDMVSLASNHTLDYSYGGLYSTWEALARGGIPHAGTGRNLGAARAPATVATGNATVALLSMTTSFPAWSRAGDVRTDAAGRPGVNGLRHIPCLPPQDMENLRSLGRKIGWWMTEVEPGEWWCNPAGLHNTIYRFREGTEDGPTSVVDARDAAANLAAVRDAATRSDLVIVHVHSHEWNPREGLHAPADFLRSFARDCIADGADIVIAEGSHAPLRGIELHLGKPIFYDPGDLFRMSGTIARFPQDFFERHSHGLETDLHLATQSDAVRSRGSERYYRPWNPPRGYRTGRVTGSVVPVCTYDDDFVLQQIELHPVEWSEVVTKRPSQSGLPLRAGPEAGEAILGYLSELSVPYGTRIEGSGGLGTIRFDAR